MCGVPGSGKSRSLFWVTRAEVSNQRFWLRSVSSVIGVVRNRCSSSAGRLFLGADRGSAHPSADRPHAEGQTAGEKAGRVHTWKCHPRAVCLHSRGQIEAPSPVPSLGDGVACPCFHHEPRPGKGLSFLFLCARLGAHGKMSQLFMRNEI